VGNLAAFDPSPVDAATFAAGKEEACLGMATRIFQALTRQVFSLPSAPAPIGRMAELPAPTTLLPREKPLPKPRPPTKWEVFAQRKGIVKRKRSKLELDEPSGEYKRRYGYQKANDAEAVPYIEAGAHEETGVEDPFTLLAREKKERVKRQDKRQVANLKNAVKAGGAGALPPTLRLAAALPEHGRGAPARRRELQPELKAASRQAATSTASMGKFDRMVKGEDPALRRPAGKKKGAVLAVTATAAERAQQGKLVDHILRKNADDVVDIGRAIGKFEASAREGAGAHAMKFKGANKKGRITGKKERKAPPTLPGVRKAPPGKAAAGGGGRGGRGGKGGGGGRGRGKGRA
jgi:regulator of ribosome biosynthesis